MLEIDAINAGYDRVQVLFGLSLRVEPGEILAVMGRNGAGKTTTLRAIMGHIGLNDGEIRLDGEVISALPAQEVPRRGIGYVPQGRRLFGDMSVAENLEVGLMTRKKDAATRAQVLDLFPRLGERLDQRAATLSGGEQQMLAMGRAMCLEPRVLVLDEPTEGLQPSMIALIRDVVVRLRATGVAVVLVEQRVEAVRKIADRISFVEHGQVVETVAAGGLTPELAQRYVGV